MATFNATYDTAAGDDARALPGQVMGGIFLGIFNVFLLARDVFGGRRD